MHPTRLASGKTTEPITTARSVLHQPPAAPRASRVRCSFLALLLLGAAAFALMLAPSLVLLPRVLSPAALSRASVSASRRSSPAASRNATTSVTVTAAAGAASVDNSSSASSRKTPAAAAAPAMSTGGSASAAADGAADAASAADVLSQPRMAVRRLLSREQAEGDGARVRRSIGRPEMRSLDPFLMLDEFRVTAPAGFPDHPHRGFETVTFMLQGSFIHEDFDGHKGTIGPGDLQWMTAGRGIVHAEMPATEELNHGLQLWVNLAAKDKMIPSAYQELHACNIPKVERAGVQVAVVAGASLGASSPVYTRTPTMYLSFNMQPNAKLRQTIPQGWNAFIYTLAGSATIGAADAEPTGPHHTVELGPGDGVEVWNRGSEECRFVLIGGQPIGEPVAQYGPFVMNTEAELRQTFVDYQMGMNGFEKAKGWRSSIHDGVA